MYKHNQMYKFVSFIVIFINARNFVETSLSVIFQTLKVSHWTRKTVLFGYKFVMLFELTAMYVCLYHVEMNKKKRFMCIEERCEPWI